jgi:NIMA (never in mitosis gene a)-related kinase
LKPENIFLSIKGNVKIGDFGISRILNTQYYAAKSLVGTFPYLAPEIFEELPQTFKLDIWGLGCILHEMCNLKKTFYDPENTKPLNFKNLILYTNESKLNKKYSSNL